jgi:hypothetical protein
MRSPLAAFAALLIVCSAPPAIAAGAAPSEAEAESARAIDVLNLITPVLKDGKLDNYLFLNVRIHLADGVDVWRARDKGHFLRDALLRTTHSRQWIAIASADGVDQPAAAEAIAVAGRAVLGAGTVKSVEILDVTSLRAVRPRK